MESRMPWRRSGTQASPHHHQRSLNAHLPHASLDAGCKSQSVKYPTEKSSSSSEGSHFRKRSQGVKRGGKREQKKRRRMEDLMSRNPTNQFSLFACQDTTIYHPAICSQRGRGQGRLQMIKLHQLRSRTEIRENLSEGDPELGNRRDGTKRSRILR